MKFSDVKNYFEGNFNYFVGAEEHIREQAQYRAILCYECLENKRCRGCGCNTPKVVLAPNKIDSKQRWGVMLGPDEWKEFKKGSEYANVWNFFNNVLLNVKSLPTREDVERKLNYKFPEGDAGDAEFGKVLNLVLVELLPCRVDCIRIKLDSIDIKYDEEILKRIDALRIFQLLHDKEEITIQLKITDTSWCSELVKVEA